MGPLLWVLCSEDRNACVLGLKLYILTFRWNQDDTWLNAKH